MSTEKKEESPKISTREITTLDQFVQILEISFIFLITFSLIALFDAVFDELNLYGPIGQNFLGISGIGPLNGGNWEAIVRITFIFNLLLFAFSLFFGLWMRKTRDGWSYEEMGYTLNTPGYSFADLMRRGLLLGIISIIIFYIARGLVMTISPEMTFMHTFAYSLDADTLYTQKALLSEYYFGIVEMGLIWPLSAGFFFFAYAHNSLNAKFPTGVANVLSTFFYVFYLQFFFLIPSPDKLTQLWLLISNPIGSMRHIEFWVMSIALWIILYINFSAFAETKSIVLPFIMNFVLNVGTTLIQALNTTFYSQVNNMMIIPFIICILVVIVWYFVKRTDFSTFKQGRDHLSGFRQIQFHQLIGFVLVFIALSFLLPGWINEVLFLSDTGRLTLTNWYVPTLYAFNFILLIFLAIVVLTYEPTNVWDVLLLTNEGTPIASHIELFETDEILISGFFTALTAVDEELSEDKGLKSIKRGEREILIEEGVFSRIIALADRDQSSIRQQIINMHREFEISEGEDIKKKSVKPSEYTAAQKLVKKMGDLSIRFNIPPQTKWIGSISLALAPTMIFLIGLLR